MSEQLSPHLPKVIDFEIPSHLSSNDPETFELLKQNLEASGIDTKNVVFSGFDGGFIDKSDGLPKPPMVHVMDANSFRLKPVPQNAFQYAEGYEHPVVGVYDASKLRAAYKPDNADGDFEIEDIFEEVVTKNSDDIDIKIMPNPIILPEDNTGYFIDTVVHEDFPEKSPNDALVCLVTLRHEHYQ